MDHELIYIEPTDKDIALYKELVKSQGEEVCRDEFDKFYISESMKHSMFGYLSISQKAVIGRFRRGATDRYHLNAFIFCSYTPNEPNDLLIEIVCAKKERNLGKILIKQLEIKALELGYETLTVFSLSGERLRKWYENQGFVYIRTIPIQRSIQKLYQMRKTL